MANKISSDMIAKRLQQSSQPQRNYNNYDDDGDINATPYGENYTYDTTEQKTITPGFLAATAGIFLLLGGGTYAYLTDNLSISKIMSLGQINEVAYTSILENKCGAFWKKSVRDDMSYSCYLTNDVGRLCNPQEKEHLVMITKKWSMENKAYMSRMVVAGVKMVTELGGMQSDIFDLGQGFAGGASPSELAHSIKGLNKIKQSQNNFEKNNQALIQELKMKKIGQRELSEQIGSLARAGYIKKSDFGWRIDDVAARAFEGIPADIPSPCANKT